MAKIKIPIQLGDPAYFKNKSWTLSFNFNTKSWVSFHSYLPNFYIAENNFFYSGLNNCCGDFDFVAAEIPSLIDCTIYGYCLKEGCELDCLIELGLCCSLPTTTTTSTTIILPTTTTTTTLFGLCDIEGEVVELCDITTTTTTTVCVRPEGLDTYHLITGYMNEGTPVDSTSDQYTACAVMTWLGDNPSVTRTTIGAQTTGIYIGSHLYADNGTDDCECVPDGWYFTDETMFYEYVFHVEDCIITEVYDCNPPTTTTSTTILTTTTTTTTLDCGLVGEATCVYCEPVEFEIIDVEWFTTTTTTTLEPTTTTSTTTEEITTTTTTTTAFVCNLNYSIDDIDFSETTTTTTLEPTTTTSTTTIAPTTTTTTTSLDLCCYGALYNFYITQGSGSDSITSSDDWDIPTLEDFNQLIEYFNPAATRDVDYFAAGQDRVQASASTALDFRSIECGWDDIIQNDDVYGFNDKGNGYRSGTSSATFREQEYYSEIWTKDTEGDQATYGLSFMNYTDGPTSAVQTQSWSKTTGMGIRLIADATGVADGTTTNYIGNDGKQYIAISINEKYWLTQNLEETQLRSGSYITGYDGGVYTPINSSTWYNFYSTQTGALCVYDDNTGYLCVQSENTTTTTTTIA